MRFVYFTKLLKGKSLVEMAQFLQQAGLAGPDLTVRKGFPVNPTNVATQMPEAKKIFADHGLQIPMVSASTNLIDPESREARTLFEACAKADVEAIKIGYFRYSGDYARDLSRAANALQGFANLSEKTGVKTCYHTHSGSYIGSNCAGMRQLLVDLDPHYVGAFVDTGHQTRGGAPFRMALDMVADWFSLLAIKDIQWNQVDGRWKASVVPAGDGIVDWKEVSRALSERRFDGIVTLHAEYHLQDESKRLSIAKQELEFLQEKFKR